MAATNMKGEWYKELRAAHLCIVVSGGKNINMDPKKCTTTTRISKKGMHDIMRVPHADNGMHPGREKLRG